MEILVNLGVNSTLFVQLALFLFTFVVVNNLTFKPYARAHRDRHDRTLGEEELAKKLFTEGQDLEFHYEKRAREINDQIRAIYEIARNDAMKKYSDILDAAREEAQRLTKQTREQIQKNMEAAQSALTKEIPGLTRAITERLVGKEFSA